MAAFVKTVRYVGDHLDRMVRKSVDVGDLERDARYPGPDGQKKRRGDLERDARYQRCMVRFERNVLARVTPATARSDGARAWSAASPTDAAR